MWMCAWPRRRCTACGAPCSGCQTGWPPTWRRSRRPRRAMSRHCFGWLSGTGSIPDGAPQIGRLGELYTGVHLRSGGLKGEEGRLDGRGDPVTNLVGECHALRLAPACGAHSPPLSSAHPSPSTRCSALRSHVAATRFCGCERPFRARGGAASPPSQLRVNPERGPDGIPRTAASLTVSRL